MHRRYPFGRSAKQFIDDPPDENERWVRRQEEKIKKRRLQVYEENKRNQTGFYDPVLFKKRQDAGIRAYRMENRRIVWEKRTRGSYSKSKNPPRRWIPLGGGKVQGNLHKWKRGSVSRGRRDLVWVNRFYEQKAIDDEALKF